MKRKKHEPGLTRYQKEAIEQAESGNPLRLLKLIAELKRTMTRLSGPINDDELGRWTIAMREHYGFILGLCKKHYKRLYPKGGIHNGKLV